MNKKKIFAIFMIAASLLAFAGCNSKKEKPKETEEEHVHEFGSWITAVEPTCTKEGVMTRTCTDSECNEVERKSIDPAGHTAGEWVKISSPDCTTEGEQYKKCTECMAELSREKIPALGHDYVETLIYPNRLEEGYTFNVCSRCNDGYDDNMIPSWGKVEYLYTADKNTGTCKIIDIVCNETAELHIPDYIAEYKVVELGDRAIADETSLTLIRLPDGIIKIGERAFEGCTALTEITFGDKLESIGANAFRSCESLEWAILPDSLLEIGDGCFRDCRSLKSLNLSDAITEIPFAICDGCTSLSEAVFSENVTVIGNRAFAGCASLEVIPVLKSATIIGTSSFAGCASLKELELSDTLKEIGKSAFAGVYSLEKVTVPSLDFWFSLKFKDGLSNPVNGSALLYAGSTDPVTELTEFPGAAIPAFQFYGYDHLTSLALPGSVTTVGKAAFALCTSLKTFTAEEGLTILSPDVFAGCTELTEVTLPNSLAILGDYAFSRCLNLAEIVLPESLYHIGRYAFERCGALLSVAVPDKVNVISEGSFYGCELLAEIKLPASLTYIGDSAFSGCASLVTVEIPEGTRSVGKRAFAFASLLESVFIPESIRSFGSGAFLGCYEIKHVDIADMKSYLSASFPDSTSSPILSITEISLKGKPVSVLIVPGTINAVSGYAIQSALGIDAVYYAGDAETFERIAKSGNNSFLLHMLQSELVYYYSASKPSTEGRFWHYNAEGAAVRW